MRRGQSVIGFTEAELGFFLVLVVIGSALVTESPQTSRETVPKTRFDSLSAEFDRLRDSLKSTILPSCADKKVSQGVLFRTAIAGANRFFVRGDPYTFQDLKQQFAAEIRDAAVQKCVHQIEVRPSSNVTSADLWKGLVRLRSTFRVIMVD